MAKRFFTRDASKGMDLENGKRHYDSKGKPLGGIKATVVNADNQQIEVEQGEVIITRDAVSNPKKYKIEGTTKEILSTLNQEGGGVPINESDAEILAKYRTGGSIGDMTPSELKAFYDTPEGRKLDAETYAEWKSLVNMSKSEITNFYNSPEGKQAGLSESEAKEQGIDSGRESARWIMKMKDIPYKLWTSNMWRWAKKQISFIKRMSGMKGDLYDDKGRKTRKHTALLIWGHNPTNKFRGGGEISQKALSVETNDLTDFVRKYFIKDGRIDVSDAMQELFGNKRGKSVADEYRKRIQLHKKGGLTISQLAHNLWEQHRDEVRDDIDDSDFRNAVEEVLISEYGVNSMIKSLMEKSSQGVNDDENEYWMNQYDESQYEEPLSDEEMNDYFSGLEQLENQERNNEESIPDLIEGLKVLADSLEGAEKKEIEDVIEGLEILLESDDKKFEGGGSIENEEMEETVIEHFKPYKSVEELSDLHRVPVSDILEQLHIGEKTEMEHTTDYEIARIIALQHIEESPKYYTLLESMEEKFEVGGELKEIESNKIVFKPITTPL